MKTWLKRGDAGRTVKERAVDPGDHAVALLFERLDGLVHGAGAVERRAERDDGLYFFCASC